jgi:beta-lactamase regulating signal transducer with metallopeptidase domain
MVFDHVWQSTLVAILVYVLTLLFRNNRATIRYWLWFAASLKFLLPFSLLAALGRTLFVQTVPAQSMAVLTQMRPIAMPFSGIAPAAADGFPWAILFRAIWLLGFVLIAKAWMIRWRRLAAVARSARMLAFDLPVAVGAAPSLLEPGLVGMWRPVILLPEGIANRLTGAEIDTILCHELCHLRRRDNLLALIHMLVECMFWFHPLVWFIGARLVEERERACDEDVIAGGKSPLEYAQTILKGCQLYVRSPLPCASGVSGADLDRRISAIMAQNDILEIDPGRKALLAGVALLAVMAPFVGGGLKPAPVVALARSLASSFVPAAPRENAAMAEPVTPPSRPAQRTRRHSEPSSAAIEVHQTLLAAPAIRPVTSPMLVLAPEIATDPPPAEMVCRAPQSLPGTHLSGPQVCLPQQEWDRLKQQKLVLMPDGRTLARLDEGHTIPIRPCYTAGSASATFVTTWQINCF